MRKAPFRPKNEISQQFNSGMVGIYRVTDCAEPGRQPVEKLEHKWHLRYEEQRLGINRLYLSRQNNAEITMVIRVPRVAISNQDVAILHDGTQYRIDTVQSVSDCWPACLDLSLVRQTHDYEVSP